MVQYWIDGNIYNFAAVVNGDVTPDGDNMPATITYFADGTTDLLYAEQKGIEGKKSGNGAVAFTFDHLLSKVKVTFNNTSKASEHNKYNYKVTNVQIVGTYASADYDLTATPQAWDVATGTGSYTAELGHIVAANANTVVTEALAIYHSSNGVSNHERLVIPGAYTALTVNCHIELYVGNVTTPVDVIEYSQPVQITLEKGKCYNFILSAGVGEEIKFTVTQVNGWTPQDANGVETPVEVTPLAPEHNN